MSNRIRQIFRVIGPGIVFASLCIGETHLALLAYTGALYGYSLLWVVIMVHVLYYPNFEYAQRYAVVTGETLIDGYARVKIGRFLSVVLILFMFVTPPLIMSSLLGLSGSVLYAALPMIGYESWCVILFIITLSIILGGRYKMIERISKLMVLIIVLTAILVFLVSPPEPTEFFAGLVPTIPATAGVMIVIVAILRAPTDPAVSIFLSGWAVKKRSEWLENESKSISQSDIGKMLKNSLFDVRLGFVISCLVAVIFLSIGATVLRPLGIVPEGVEVSLRLSRIFTDTLGPWMFPVFIITLFAAFWGGYLAAMDGIKTLFGNLTRQVFKVEKSLSNRLTIGYLLLVTTSGLLMTTIVKRPMIIVLLAVSVGLINIPLIFGLNIYCVNRLISKAYQPSNANKVLAILGFILGILGLILLILVRVLKVI